MSKQLIWRSVIILSIVIVVWAVTVSALSWHALHHFRFGNWQHSGQSAQWAQTLLTPLERTLGRIFPDLQLWSDSLQLINSSSQLAEVSSHYLPATFAREKSALESAPTFRNHLHQLQQDVDSWTESYNQSHFLSRFIRQQLPSAHLQTLVDDPKRLKETFQNIVIITDHLLQGKHRYAVLLQNNDELRATGGFMGSYLLFEIQDGLITQFEIQDIYVPDGQYQGYTNPPPGLDEYLSGGKGFRLPDANWNPDFPAASQDILQFFALGKETELEGLVALNLNVAEEILRVFGSIHLPDYDQTVTAENLSILARLDRTQFFPGSQQKSQFLNALFTQLKLNMAELSQEDMFEIVQIISQASQQKNIQVYSRQPEIHKLLIDQRLTGQVLTQGSERYLFLVESNVGINKANRLVSREVFLHLDTNRTVLKVVFTNRNPETNLKAERGEYINYQRVLLPAEYQVRQITIEGKQLSQWDEQVVTTSSGEKLKQLGFLVPIAAEHTSQFVLDLEHPPLALDQVVIQKQSGLPATPYYISSSTQQLSVLLERDEVISLDKTKN